MNLLFASLPAASTILAAAKPTIFCHRTPGTPPHIASLATTNLALSPRQRGEK